MNDILVSRVTAGLTLLVCLLGAAPQAWAEDGAAEMPAAVDEMPAAVEAGEAAPTEAAPADEVVVLGDDVDWGEEETTRDPTKGLVQGRVTSKSNGDALIEARVTVQGTPFSTLTDVDGNFELELPPGTYEFRVWYELHQPQRVQGIVVEAGAEQQLDVALVGDDDSVLEIVVEAQADKSKAAVQMEKRKRAAVVMDAVSGEEMSKTPDSSAADAMKRVVGASVVDGKYLVVRGLGGRYNTTLLEGVSVPSPEPDMPSVPLDLFPSSLLSSVSVAKTATPDLPGNFAGGALLIDSKQYPTEFKLNLKAGFSGDSVTTFQQGPRYTGGSSDWLGFDDGTRALPAAVPGDGPTNELNREERANVGKSFDQTWAARNESLPANFNFGASVGDTVSAFGNRFGYLASLSWGQSWDLEGEYNVDVALDGSKPENATEIAGIRKVKLGGLGSFSYQLGPSDDLAFITLFSRSADDRAQVTRGFSNNDRDFEKTDLAFIARQLSFNQLRGHHRFESLGQLELDWQGNFSVVNRDEPDTRTIYYEDMGDGSMRMNKERGGQRLFSELDDRTFGGGFDLALPMESWKPKVGVLYSQSARDYGMRRFLYEDSRATPEVLGLPANEIFNDETIGRYFQFKEQTRTSDSYTADFQLVATYAMADVTLFDPLRVIFGARFERAHTELVHDSPFASADDAPKGVDRLEEDVLPSVNLVYALGEQMNLRAAYAMTVARPQFRELSSASWYDFDRRRFYSGNPELERSRIHNADLRFEFFPGATEVLAASVFGKVFENPIEELFFTDTGKSVTYDNADGGYVYGIELEGRVGLYHLSKSLREFGVTGNLTLATSEVEIDEPLMTNQKRPLNGQSPYAVNFGLLYENELTGTTAQLLYNVFGPRLDVAGIQGLPDIYEDVFHRVDLTFTQGLGSGFDMKLAATNLLDQEETYSQGDTEVSRFSPGVGASASLGWTF
ncbi:TonB-dependent receptor [Vulgatibacter sp.]|uniref:TonB-dependent receptor n=1 Tax=Vulgatibacter sp. TaxID=1971226 RepID=UPI0035633F96